MMPVTHTYILSQLYRKEGRGIDDDVLLGNILPDIIGDYKSRHGQNPDPRLSNIHLMLHDRIKEKTEIEYDTSSRLQTGMAIHIMADNYSRVGTYWRNSSSQAKGFLRKLENRLQGTEEIEEGKRNEFKRRLLQAGLDILILRDCSEEMERFLNRAMTTLKQYERRIISEFSASSFLKDIPEEHLHERFASFISRWGTNLSYYMKKPIRAYAAIRVIDDKGESTNKPKFLPWLEKHRAYQIVQANLPVLEDWRTLMENTVLAISGSGIGLEFQEREIIREGI